MRSAALVALALLAGSCGGGTLRPSEPPAAWSDELAAERKRKDAEFRQAPDTPPRAEDVASFTGLEYWPPDPAWRLTGPIEVNDRLERFTIITTTGKPRPCEKYGRVRIERGGALHTLQVYRLLDVAAEPGRDAFFLPFLDETSGRETYEAGRYVDVVGPKGGPYVVDFNRAYNPLCAYGAAERFACPVTPAENRLPFRVEAGERGYRKTSPA
jgi:uncharacterized protein (DUF1684 family)